MSKKFILGFFLCNVVLFSQTDSIYNFTLPELKITQIENGKTITYDFEKEKNFFTLNDSFLVTNPDKYKYKAHINDIRKIAVRDGTHFGQAAAITGAVVGGLGLFIGIGFTIALRNDENAEVGPLLIPAFTLAGVLVGALIGGIVGLGAPNYESFPLKEKDIARKKDRLKKIMRAYKL